jgi:arylsulfatase A-like enzyme
LAGRRWSRDRADPGRACRSDQLKPDRSGEPVSGGRQPNIVVIWSDDIGISNLSCYSMGLMGYHTPNIDRIAREGMLFTDYYGEQSCTAGRSSFIIGQSVFHTGLSKVGVPASPIGLSASDPTTAEMLKPLGYATGQFGKNHVDDRNEFLPTVHGFDEFYGNLYHVSPERRGDPRGLALRINLTVGFLLRGSDSLDSKQWRVTFALGGCVGRIWSVLGRS